MGVEKIIATRGAAVDVGTTIRIVSSAVVAGVQLRIQVPFDNPDAADALVPATFASSVALLNVSSVNFSPYWDGQRIVPASHKNNE